MPKKKKTADSFSPVLFPAFIEKEFKDRNLGFLSHGNQIMTERGESFVIDSFSTLLLTCFNHDLLVFTDELATFPWLGQVIAMGDKPFCSEQGDVLGIRLRGAKNTSRWIASATAWGHAEYQEEALAKGLSLAEATLSWLAMMRKAYIAGGVGTSPSPGAWGMAMFRQTFKELHGEDWKAKRHRRPPGSYAEKIRYESSGARSEVLQLDVRYDLAYEIDRKNAYGAALSEAQPTGKTYRVRGDAVQFYPFYFVECEVTVHEELPLGVFPLRQGEGRNRHPVFPTAAGTYRTWLWNREVDVSRRDGLTVVIVAGFGWTEATFDFQPFVEKVAELRDSAPKELQPLLKTALVAFTGRLGMPEERYVLVSGNDRAEEDRALGFDGVVYDWWIHQEFNAMPQSMPHIFSHILMLCRLSLYEKAKWSNEQGLNVIATNTDAVLCERTDASIPAKGKPVNTGDWTALELHHVVVPANRHLISDEKVTRPGIPKKYR